MPDRPTSHDAGRQPRRRRSPRQSTAQPAGADRRAVATRVVAPRCRTGRRARRPSGGTPGRGSRWRERPASGAAVGPATRWCTATRRRRSTRRTRRLVAAGGFTTRQSSGRLRSAHVGHSRCLRRRHQIENKRSRTTPSAMAMTTPTHTRVVTLKNRKRTLDRSLFWTMKTTEMTARRTRPTSVGEMPSPRPLNSCAGVDLVDAVPVLVHGHQNARAARSRQRSRTARAAVRANGQRQDAGVERGLFRRALRHGVAVAVRDRRPSSRPPTRA